MTHRLSPRQQLLHDGVNRIHNLSERQRIGHTCLVSNSSSTPPVMNPLDKDGDGVLDQFDADVDGDGVLNVNELGLTLRNLTVARLGVVPDTANQSGTIDFSDLGGYPEGSIILDFSGVCTTSTGALDAKVGTSAIFRFTGTVPIFIDVSHGPGLPNGSDGFVSLDGQTYSLTSPISDEFEMNIDDDTYTVTRVSGSTNNPTPFRWRSDSFASEVEYFSEGDGGPNGYSLRILIPADSNGDGIPDFCDTDRDGDGVSDLVESGDTTAIAADTDGDGSISVEEANDAGLTDNDGDGAWDQLNG